MPHYTVAPTFRVHIWQARQHYSQGSAIRPCEQQHINITPQPIQPQHSELNHPSLTSALQKKKKKKIAIKITKSISCPMSEDIRPFKINVPNEALSLLKQKLSVASFPTETSFTDDAQCGTRLSDMKRLTEHWKNGFDWREQEAKLNKLPHFTTGIAIDGFEELQIHFVHQRSKRLGSIPLLFCHGCLFPTRMSTLLP